jgi:hypothetical protein
MTALSASHVKHLSSSPAAHAPLATCRPAVITRYTLLRDAEWSGTPMFKSSVSNVTFYMNTTPMDYTTAERMCALNGAHLATFMR